MRISSSGARPPSTADDGLRTGEAPADSTVPPTPGATSDGLDPPANERHPAVFTQSLQSGSPSPTPSAAQLQAGRDAKTIHDATEGGLTGWGTNEEAIFGILEGKSASELDLLSRAYEDHYGKSLATVLRQELGGNDLERAEDLLLGTTARKPGLLPRTIELAPPSPADDTARLKQAMDGIGTDEATVRAILQPRSKPEIDIIAREYEQRYGHPLRDRLDDELAGRDQVELLEQMFDRGKIDARDPAANVERLRRLREQQAVEQGFGSWATSHVQDVLKGQSDEARLERNLARAQRSMETDDRAGAARLLGYAEADLDSLRRAKDSAAEAAATGAAVVASTAVVIGTAGAATPLVIAGAAAVAGGTASAGAYTAVQGDAADPADIAREGFIGAAAGVTAGIGFPASTASRTAAAAGARQAAVEVGELAAARNLGRAALQGAREGAKTGAAGGATDGAVRSATERETWNDGLMTGAGRVAARTAEGAAAGAVFGGAAGLATAPMVHAVERSVAHRVEARDLTGAVASRIEQHREKGMEFFYTPGEVRQILAKGREVGLDRRHVEDLALVGSRTKKPLPADELIQQMENYTQVVLPRAYPYRFNSPEHFARFKSDLLDGLNRLGIPTADVRIQGSALRTPRAADIDIMVRLTAAEFDRRLALTFTPPGGHTITHRHERVSLSNLSRRELDQLLDAIRADRAKPTPPFEFNAWARTFLHAHETRKMRRQESGTDDLVKELAKTYGRLDISIVSEGGSFDVRPQLKIEQ